MHPQTTTAPTTGTPLPGGSVRALGAVAAALIVAGALAWAYAVHVYGWTYYGSVARYGPGGFDGAPFVTSTGIGPIKRSIVTLGVMMLVNLVAAVAFLIWLHRARRGAEALGGEQRHGRGWVIGAWFVPFANLVLPVRIVADVYRASAPPTVARPVPAGLVAAWWATAVGAWLLFPLGTVLRASDQTYGAAVLFSIQGLLTLAAGGLAAAVITRIGRWQSGA